MTTVAGASSPLFFSGGTGLRGLSRALVSRTHHSRHLVTPFDSGGSSAKLREAFAMPAVGDLRNRLLALSDSADLERAALRSLLSLRFPTSSDPADLVARLRCLISGERGLEGVPSADRSTIRSHLGSFREAMPPGFDLRGAAIGNLVLAGGYLQDGRTLDPVIARFSRLVAVRGIVRPIVEDDLHVAARLIDGSTVVGQHRLTGKEGPAPPSPIERLFLTASVSVPEPMRPRISPMVAELIRTADLIVFPVGSFYTSIVANLIPIGVADAIADSAAPKVYLPNPGPDPEEAGMDLADKTTTLLRYLQRAAAPSTPVDRLLDAVVVDASVRGSDASSLRRIEALGVEVVDAAITTTADRSRLDDDRAADVLLSLVAQS